MASSASFVARSARPPVKRVIAWGSPGRLMAAAAPWIGAATWRDTRSKDGAVSRAIAVATVVDTMPATAMSWFSAGT